MQDTEDHDHQFKLVLLGDSTVGKSSILTRFTRNEFNEGQTTTLGVEFSSKILPVQGKNIKVQVWDTAGQEKFKAMAKIYYRGSVGALLVYDVTNKQTFENIQKWYEEIKEYSEKNFVVIMLVGNKSDMEEQRVISKEEGVKWAEENKMGFVETSAKDGTNIEFTFTKLVEQIYQLMVKKTIIQVSEVNETQKQNINSQSQVLMDPKKSEKQKEKTDKKNKSCC